MHLAVSQKMTQACEEECSSVGGVCVCVEMLAESLRNHERVANNRCIECSGALLSAAGEQTDCRSCGATAERFDSACNPLMLLFSQEDILAIRKEAGLITDAEEALEFCSLHGIPTEGIEPGELLTIVSRL